MKHKVTCLLASLLLAACTAQRQTVVEPDLPAAVSAAQAPVNAPAEAAPSQVAAPAKKPAAKPSVPVNPAVKTEPQTKPPAPAAAPAPASPQQEAPSPTPQALIGQARQAQTLSAPPQDTPSFEDEDLISLEGRRLSPQAYSPLRPDDTQAPWSGESLKYGVYYTFIRAGTAYIKNRGLSTVNGRDAYLLQTTAFSASVIDAFFKVRDVNYSWLDAENFYSLGYLQSVREGSYKRDEWLIFDYPRQLFYGEVQKKEDPRVISGGLPMRVLDMLSSLYFVRAQKLELGKDIVFDIINREKQYPLVVKVLGKETVKTDAGKFDCIVVEPQFRGEGIFVSKGKSLKVWLTDDAYKMPVKMKAEVFIGSVSAELLEYKRN